MKSLLQREMKEADAQFDWIFNKKFGADWESLYYVTPYPNKPLPITSKAIKSFVKGHYEKALSSLATKLVENMGEIIGKNEKKNSYKQSWEEFEEIRVRNEYKDNLRSRLAEVLKVYKKI